MLIKIMLCCLLVLTTTLIGVAISRKQKVKRDIFDELIVFNSEFLCEAALYNQSVVNKLKNVGGEIAITFCGASECLSRGERFFCEDKRLNDEQRNVVSNFVNSLGTGDSETQKQMHNLFNEKLKNIYLSQNLIYQKYAKLYIRLGFALGLIISVLLF